jgi:hypothetical protein
LQPLKVLLHILNVAIDPTYNLQEIRIEGQPIQIDQVLDALRLDSYLATGADERSLGQFLDLHGWVLNATPQQLMSIFHECLLRNVVDRFCISITCFAGNYDKQGVVGTWMQMLHAQGLTDVLVAIDSLP